MTALLAGTEHEEDFEAGLDKEDFLRGKRVGVLRFYCGLYGEEVDKRMEEALGALRAAGAEVVDVPDDDDVPDHEIIDKVTFFFHCNQSFFFCTIPVFM